MLPGKLRTWNKDVVEVCDIFTAEQSDGPLNEWLQCGFILPDKSIVQNAIGQGIPAIRKPVRIYTSSCV